MLRQYKTLSSDQQVCQTNGNFQALNTLACCANPHDLGTSQLRSKTESHTSETVGNFGVPVISKIAKPTVAAATLFTPKLAPPIHRLTVIKNATAVIFSSRLMTPSLSSSLRAAAGASGVSLVSAEDEIVQQQDKLHQSCHCNGCRNHLDDDHTTQWGITM